MVLIVGVIVLIAVNIIILSVSSTHQRETYGLGRTGIAVVAPFQDIFSSSIRFAGDIWRHYFQLVSTAKENDRLTRQLELIREQNLRYKEVELSNARLRSLLDFKQSMNRQVISAEVIGKDPSPWFQSVIIDKGIDDGVNTGFPVVIPKGIVGQITEASGHYAKVLLLIDQNNAVDGLIQQTRARGIVKGASGEYCIFKYVLRKHEIRTGDIVISSGLDAVFPKGLRIGRVTGVIKRNSGIFQEVSVTPFVDFEKLEEVLVILQSEKQKVDER